MPRRVLLIAADSSRHPLMSAQVLLPPELIANKFKTVNYDFQWATNLIQGQRMAAYNRPSLIIIAHQPTLAMDGLELCRQLKSSHLTNNIPVVIYSDVKDLEVLNQAYILGTTFFMRLNLPHKPFDMVGELFDSCLRILDLKTAEGIRFLRRQAGTNQPTESFAIGTNGASHVYN